MVVVVKDKTDNAVRKNANNVLRRYMNTELISKAFESTKNIATNKYKYILGDRGKDKNDTKLSGSSSIGSSVSSVSGVGDKPIK